MTDSKKLTPKQRQRFVLKLKKKLFILHMTGFEVEVIDALNIHFVNLYC